jgi:signal transduction histidine kinase
VEPEGPRELVALAESFNRMARALGANLTAQRDFIANASHQLRTPLTGIKLRLEAIREEGGETAAQAARAESELDRLNSLVDDLLSLARASTLEAAGAPVDLADAARDAVRRWTGPAQSADQQLSLGREEPAPMWGDPTDIAHILDNLIENAIRYGPAGNRITIDTARQGSVSSLTVSDTGPGIPEQDRSRIFERFYRGSNGRQAGPGTGLGLAIVGELAERWRGRVELAGGDGARFEVSFPARSDAP